MSRQGNPASQMLIGMLNAIFHRKNQTGRFGDILYENDS